MINSGVLKVSDSVYVFRVNEVGCYLDSQHEERLEAKYSTMFNTFAINQIETEFKVDRL